MGTSGPRMSCTAAISAPGWFLLLPYASLVGFGAVILGFFQRETN